MAIRYFKCKIAGCGGLTGFDIKDLSKPNKNIITCVICKKQWVGTILKSCCGKITVRFHSIEASANRGMIDHQVFKS